MIKPPYTKWINDIKAKLGFTRTMTASGADVVDAVNKQSQQVGNVESGVAIIVNGDIATQAVPSGGYAYIKNNTHELSEGLYKNTSGSAFPVSGGIANSTIFTAVQNGGLNAIISAINDQFGTLTNNGVTIQSGQTKIFRFRSVSCAIVSLGGSNSTLQGIFAYTGYAHGTTRNKINHLIQGTGYTVTILDDASDETKRFSISNNVNSILYISILTTYGEFISAT